MGIGGRGGGALAHGCSRTAIASVRSLAQCPRFRTAAIAATPASTRLNLSQMGATLGNGLMTPRTFTLMTPMRTLTDNLMATPSTSRWRCKPARLGPADRSRVAAGAGCIVFFWGVLLASGRFVAVPLHDGTLVEVDPFSSPSAALQGVTDTGKEEIRDQLLAMQAQLNAFLARLQ